MRTWPNDARTTDVGLVLDLTSLAAAYGTRLLAEAGHAVVRVEPRDGDRLRRLGPQVGEASALDLEHGAFHLFLNAGKRSLCLNLECAAGREVFLRLAARAEAVVASEPFPLASDAAQANPRLVTMLVDDGLPELCAYARSGLLSITGHPGRSPALLGGHAAYAVTGLYAALATSAAMLRAQLNGAGETVHLSVAECLESLMEQPMVAFLAMGRVTERRGYRGAVTAVSGAFACADGYWMVSVPQGAKGWARLMDWVQDPLLLADDALADEAERLKKRDFILDRLEQWSRRFPRQELVAEAQRRHIPASPVATPSDLLQDPQLLARGFLKDIDHPLLGRRALPIGAIATVTGTAVAPAPRLGEHNAQLLADLGYDQLECRALLESGVV